MNKKSLENLVARAVLRVPDINPKNGHIQTREIAFTLRPSWSNISPYLSALPGGRISVFDLDSILTQAEINDPDFIPNADQLITAGLETVKRELFEELGLVAVGLFYVETRTNKASWITYGYASDLTEKPTLLIKPDSAGTHWMDERQILHGKPRLLSGHLSITRNAIKALNSRQKI